MKKGRHRYICQNCGFSSIKWLGQCSDCGTWNSLVLQKESKPTGPTATLKTNVVSIDSVTKKEGQRLPSRMGELDCVLGGGIVPGSLILVGGEPGIGKSTLLLQVAGLLADHGPVLYVSGEESLLQIKLRGERINALGPQLMVMAETDLIQIEQAIDDTQPCLIVIDSIQTMNHPEVDSVPGSVSQLREVGLFFLQLSKERNIPVILVGHVTKEGFIAGPKIIEHLVDCVLYFEGDRHHSYRLIRCVKNRFGPLDEIGVFQMTAGGLVEVPNPSGMFIAEKPKDAPGSAIVVAMEGTRPLMVEVQALVTPTAFGHPQRSTTGVDRRRISMFLAVLEKRVGMRLGMHDVYVNVAGGFKLSEPAGDLGIIAAIASSFRGTAIPDGLVFCGEVGLTGEVRTVPNLARRLSEVEKMGLETIILPRRARGIKPDKDMDVSLRYIKDVGELVSILFA